MKLTLLSLLLFLAGSAAAQPRKAVFIILDGISADALEKTSTPNLDEIAKEGGYTRAWLGGIKGSYSQSPTVSAVGYNHLLTATWSHKHNVFDNDIDAPNYHYWNIFRIVETANPEYHTAIFSSWEDNRTKLIGESLPEAGGIETDYSFDGLEHDTVRFPHSDDRMFYVDEAVSKEAARYIEENGPDLSWIYLQFTGDMGHMHGDSPAYTDSPAYPDAIQKADAQVGRIWSAIKQRKAASNEDWMIVVTTDHGRDAATGKHHGGHS